ncbi:MAG: hypothetical protein WDZ83_14545 [Rhizobiaceae bacterium]
MSILRLLLSDHSPRERHAHVRRNLTGLAAAALLACIAPVTAWFALGHDGLLPVPDIDPRAAIWLGSLLFFVTGFLAGVFTLHFLERFSGKGRR